MHMHLVNLIPHDAGIINYASNRDATALIVNAD